MKIERRISWFDKKTELLVSDKNVDIIDLEILKGIFSPTSEDPMMYNPYDITEIEARKLNEYMDLKFEFEKYYYQLDCFQV